jgi:hypothetical protein
MGKSIPRRWRKLEGWERGDGGESWKAGRGETVEKSGRLGEGKTVEKAGRLGEGKMVEKAGRLGERRKETGLLMGKGC